MSLGETRAKWWSVSSGVVGPVPQLPERRVTERAFHRYRELPKTAKSPERQIDGKELVRTEGDVIVKGKYGATMSFKSAADAGVTFRVPKLGRYHLRKMRALAKERRALDALHAEAVAARDMRPRLVKPL